MWVTRNTNYGIALEDFLCQVEVTVTGKAFVRGCGVVTVLILHHTRTGKCISTRVCREEAHCSGRVWHYHHQCGQRTAAAAAGAKTAARLPAT